MLHLKPLTSYLPELDREKVALDLRFGECAQAAPGQTLGYLEKRLKADGLPCQRHEGRLTCTLRKSTSSRELILWVKELDDPAAVAAVLSALRFLSLHAGYQGAVHAVFGDGELAGEFQPAQPLGLVQLSVQASEYLLRVHAPVAEKDKPLFRHASKVAEALVGLGEFHVLPEPDRLSIPFLHESQWPFLRLEIARELPNAVVSNVKVLVALVQTELSDWNL